MQREILLPSPIDFFEAKYIKYLEHLQVSRASIFYKNIPEKNNRVVFLGYFDTFFGHIFSFFSRALFLVSRV